ncbi:2-succinyl-5-enolpyruvyl-6-hydroxy-3-cyclohexene-1-carboxylic-acid synthase [Buchananella hordeovulneris]|uniref:2-succinyl-5-enolpyruvyl-6-hydroxy-3-cyclohexene-1-carboxylate synthase n=1 Tax=Buchananella hordeovulneris TaxID=52770 RepID=A0A1Q5PYV1_9ACTO|nr:2-succinyl-5-enolpyruvyl-6-hydroxy-3-cyclohexene-1-carboxylic-acid synthase [Buchananella hordeovulneris]
MGAAHPSACKGAPVPQALTAPATARLLVAQLTALGVRDFVVSPGSRSGPLALAVAQAEREGRARLTVRLDERSAAFTAVGLARAAQLAGTPDQAVAIVCTSGTAVANLHPALAEARHSGLPLLALTADRPHELRGVGASQTTNQVGIFGPTTLEFWELPTGPSPRQVEILATRAVTGARGARSGQAGPVQVNVALADPLVDDGAALPAGHVIQVAPTPPPPPVLLPPGGRTVVLAGDGAGKAARQVAEEAGVPLLAEPSSGARSGPCAIGPYRALLDLPGLGADIERVVAYGRPTLSRPVTALLARPDLEVIVVAPGGPWTDVAGRARRIERSVQLPPGDAAWLAAWQAAGARAQAALAGQRDELTPWSACLAVWQAQQAGGEPLVVGASNAIRHLDLCAPPGPGGPVVANRGLAGIDGTLATAWGLALGTGQLVRALVGDLTFLHDASSLLRGQQEAEVDLDIIVLNDGGGAIFSSLEAQQHASAVDFERVYATPQVADLAALAAAYGADYQRAATLTALRACLAQPLRGRRIVEVLVSRDAVGEQLAHIIDQAKEAARFQ